MALVSAQLGPVNGGAIQIVTGFAPFGGQPNNQFVPGVIDYVSYLIISGASASGTVSFYALQPDGSYQLLVSPTAVTISASTTYNAGFGGVSQGPFLGVQMQLILNAGVITRWSLLGSVRP